LEFDVLGLVLAGSEPDALEDDELEELEERESVMYQPLPLKTMPTG
jgi:hypothetical protein